MFLIHYAHKNLLSRRARFLSRKQKKTSLTPLKATKRGTILVLLYAFSTTPTDWVAGTGVKFLIR